MKKEVFEQQKAFAGEKIPSMSRRMVGHDYQQRQMYMITMVIEGRRLLMKCEHPDLFRIQKGLTVGALSFSAIGNRFLLQKPVLMQVQCSRRMTEEKIKNKVEECLRATSQGAVLVSPSISPGEKAVMRAAFDKGFPLIILQENGFSDLAKPGGKRLSCVLAFHHV